jgi:hypothetical protein
MEHLDLSELVKDYNNAMKVEHLLIKYDITNHTFRILKKELKLERPRISRAQRIFKTNCVYNCNNINIPAKEPENKHVPQVIPQQPSQSIVQPTIDTVVSEVKKKVKNNITIKPINILDEPPTVEIKKCTTENVRNIDDELNEILKHSNNILAKSKNKRNLKLKSENNNITIK